MQITIQAAHLRAVALAMPSNGVRKYLNGVRVEVTRTGTTLVATSGSMLHAAHRAQDNLEEAEFTIPAAVVEKMLRNKKATEFAVIFAPGGEEYTLHVPALSTTFTLVKEFFPDWKHFLTHLHPDETHTISDPELMARAWKACEIMGCKHPIFNTYARGNQAFFMVDFCAIVAPLYSSALCYGLADAPAWAKVGEN